MKAEPSRAILQQLHAAEHEFQTLKQQLKVAVSLKNDSLCGLAPAARHSLDRARVDMLEAAVKKAELNCKREELLLQLEQATLDHDAAQKEYFDEQTRLDARLAAA